MRGRGITGTAAFQVRCVALAALLVVPPAGRGFAVAAGRPVRGAGSDVSVAAFGGHLRDAARRGDARAQAKLGFAYATGRGVPQNYSVAVIWYRRAAQQGNATAQYPLGLMYDRGQGVHEDTIVAQKWLILAAANANARERDYFTRIRDAVASTMTGREVVRAQVLAHGWWRRHRW